MDEIRIIAENLSDANGLWKDSRVLRRAQLSDLAEQIHRRLEEDEEGEQTLASLYREFEEQQALQELAGEGTAAHSLTLYTRIELCKALTRLRGAEAVPLYDFPDPVIAYFQNPYAGRILQAVVELLEGGEATDAEDYADEAYQCHFQVQPARYFLCLSQSDIPFPTLCGLFSGWRGSPPPCGADSAREPSRCSRSRRGTFLSTRPRTCPLR